MTVVYNPRAFILHAASLRQTCVHCGRFSTAASRRSLGSVSVPVRPTTLLGRLPVVALVGRYPTNKLMGRNHLRKQQVPKDPHHLLSKSCDPDRPSGISPGFPRLSLSRGQLDYVLLARPPLYSPEGFHVRLACLIHAANVRSEPGSNPSLEVLIHLVAPAHPDHSPGQQGGCQRETRSPDRWVSADAIATSASASRSHAFFRGHPECQRSTPARVVAPARKGD